MEGNAHESMSKTLNELDEETDAPSYCDVVAVDEAQGFVCFPCGKIFTGRKLRAHLIEMHHLNEENEKKRSNVIKRIQMIEKNWKNETPDKLFDVYRGRVQHRTAVPRLPGLKVKAGKRCLSCYSIFEKADNYRSHFTPDMCKKYECENFEDLPFIHFQVWSNKKGLKKFEILPEENSLQQETDNANQQSTMNDSLNIDTQDNASRDDDTSDINVSSGLQSLCDTVLKEDDVDDQHLEHFIFQARPHERLEAIGCNKEEAIELLYKPSKEIHETLTSLLLQYYETARKISSEGELHDKLRITVATPGSSNKKKPFRVFSESSQGTVLKYINQVSSLIHFCLNVDTKDWTKIDPEPYFLASAQSKAMKESIHLLTCSNSTNDSRLSAIHSLLKAILFQEVPETGKPKDLFIYAFCACICVKEEKGTVKNIHYKKGIEVSPTINAILHFASITGVIELKSEETWTRPTFDLEKLRVFFTPHTLSAIGVLVSLRSICASVRKFEYGLLSYLPCEHHSTPLCAYVFGRHICMNEIGQGVKHLQKKARHILFSDTGLFPDFGDVEEFRSSLNEIFDDKRNRSAGYSFLNEPKNSRVKLMCEKKMISAGLFPRMKNETKKMFLAASKSLARIMLALVHLTGGGPTRGTELEAAPYKNSAHHLRSFFFTGHKAMMISVHTKTRGVFAKIPKVVSRHHDAETSFLLKSYILLILPILQKLCLCNEFGGYGASEYEELNKKQKN